MTVSVLHPLGGVVVLSKADKTVLRWGWLAVQDHRCGVCGVGVGSRYGRSARWVLDYQRTHDGVTCATGSECFDCVQGTTCRVCMLHLSHYRRWHGYEPRQRVNGLSPAEWVARATDYVNGDFRSLCGRRVGSPRWEADGGV